MPFHSLQVRGEDLQILEKTVESLKLGRERCRCRANFHRKQHKTSTF